MKLRLFAAVAALISVTGGSQAADPVYLISTHTEFNDFAQNYARDPQPDKVAAAMKYAAEKGLWKDENTEAPILATFSCIFSLHEARREEWKKSVAALEAEPREYFQIAISRSPGELLDAAPVSPARNDMNWACFFVTGDVKYARDVIATMAMLDERKDLYRYLAASSAQWSLAIISKDNKAVLSELQAAAAGKDAKIAAAAKDALEKTVPELRASTTKVIQEGRAAGAW